MSQRSLLEDDEGLLSQMAGVFRWDADGTRWAARVAHSQAHGFGATPEEAMKAALAAAEAKPRKRVVLE